MRFRSDWLKWGLKTWVSIWRWYFASMAENYDLRAGKNKFERECAEKNQGFFKVDYSKSPALNGTSAGDFGGVLAGDFLQFRKRCPKRKSLCLHFSI
jgi:hypothetical protein